MAIRKKVFTEKVVEHWNKIPRAVVMAPSLSELKKDMDNAPWFNFWAALCGFRSWN